jgi:hypothetical protein
MTTCTKFTAAPTFGVPASRNIAMIGGSGSAALGTSRKPMPPPEALREKL